ncbi:hypothetical protein AMK01_CH02840 [Rhizobium sp. N6212]|nr:hypothetical protein AMK01_CH02840 [Rhizobium sp. N6212]ANK98321.1 hypothetical protein AMK00_CH02843 [Rhizobium sp. N621]ANL04400.1 hypothetical protein AMJ99_CH02870 [Rhizobium esperanzae]ANL10513.1 hypothetical protein AMJ98_CH02871 [Rhizobium sp. N1341]ANL22566.1 hypothetical protein AMJ96_CH02874 [Rhizobium sp. N113]ANM35244.1 hypothetical protein AMK04_CH02873 [Rhizobium sp. N871]ANM41356.1 hypothetical protein AMK03_CH02873 [Rhizobium sp. N741]PDS96324.1 hypothetical protein CO659_
MKATAIKRYRCVCEECDPLPPIEGLHPLTHDVVDETPRKARGLLRVIAEQIVPLRRKGGRSRANQRPTTILEITPLVTPISRKSLSARTQR